MPTELLLTALGGLVGVLCLIIGVALYREHRRAQASREPAMFIACGVDHHHREEVQMGGDQWPKS